MNLNNLKIYFIFNKDKKRANKIQAPSDDSQKSPKRLFHSKCKTFSQKFSVTLNSTPHIPLPPKASEIPLTKIPLNNNRNTAMVAKELRLSTVERALRVGAIEQIGIQRLNDIIVRVESNGRQIIARPKHPNTSDRRRLGKLLILQTLIFG